MTEVFVGIQIGAISFVDEGVELCVCFGGQHPLLGLWVDSSHELPP